MTSPLALSSAATISTCEYGSEKLPLVMVDDALADLSLVRGIAARHDYRPIGPHYPGIRAAVSQAVAMPLVDPLQPLLQETFALERPAGFDECFLSVVTKGPGELAPIQRLPHFDGLERERIAVLLYLDTAPRGGTAFYRQRATGFEFVDRARFAQYEGALREDVARDGLPQFGYIGEGSELFERIHVIEDAPGRMAIYRGNSLHCAALDEGFVPDPDPATGRLSLNLFLRA